ncbi:hypothetical protein [Microbispora sp. KK1-11]|uniref:hypothetical protein n=1 Tax=Microbispora sp. KK1-11 TaxID=2053005 RepID=UPI00115C2079|nr:hypothetical protein [Microbispora sp. KK1-11]TQS26390.1 hypothetical protein FLW16_25390 [Microbispora sp. KK1-11]
MPSSAHARPRPAEPSRANDPPPPTGAHRAPSQCRTCPRRASRSSSHTSSGPEAAAATGSARCAEAYLVQRAPSQRSATSRPRHVSSNPNAQATPGAGATTQVTWSNTP